MTANTVMVKTHDVTNCLRYLINLSAPVYSTDDDGYVIDSNDNRIKITSGKDEKRHVLLFQEVFNDQEALMLNPFAELTTDHPANRFFYRTVRGGVVGWVQFAYRELIKVAVKAKDKSEKNIPTKLINLVSGIVDKVDEKTIVEFDKILKNETDMFVDVMYRDKTMMCTLNLRLLNNDQAIIDAYKEKFNIRKGTWAVLMYLTEKIFDIKTVDDLEEKYYVKPEFDGPVAPCPRMISTVHLLYKIYDKINPIIDMVDGIYTKNMSQFAIHVNNLPKYIKIASSVAQDANKINSSVARIVQKPAQQQQSTGNSMFGNLAKSNSLFGDNLGTPKNAYTEHLFGSGFGSTGSFANLNNQSNQNGGGMFGSILGGSSFGNNNSFGSNQNSNFGSFNIEKPMPLNRAPMTGEGSSFGSNPFGGTPGMPNIL